MNDDKKPAVPQTPNWREWGRVPQVMAWQACALSLNIDPHSLKQFDEWRDGHPHFKDSNFSSSAIRNEFYLRQRVLVANLPNNQEWFGKRLSAGGNSNVSLSEFSAWALSIDWDMPPELVAMARKHGEQADAPAPQKDAPVTSPSGDDKPWLIVNCNDPAPPYQPWYTPARYFARQLVKDNSTLLTKKKLLGEKVATSLANVGIFRRGKIKKKFDGGTILKAFSNVSF